MPRMAIESGEYCTNSIVVETCVKFKINSARHPAVITAYANLASFQMKSTGTRSSSKYQWLQHYDTIRL